MSISSLIKAYSPAELIARGAPKIFTTSASDWKAKMVAWFETSEDGPKRKLYPAQYEMVLIDLLAYCFSLLGKEAQAASEQRWLLFAKGKHLDVVAANNSTYRLKASPAICQLRITLDEAREEVFHLAAGTVVTSGNFSFAMDEQVIIPAGSITAEVNATAVKVGPEANGLLPGQISAFEVAQEGVSVANLTESQGGADEEDDDSLRYRAAHAHDRISKAGPKESYRQQVRAFSSAIIDVEVVRPQPGHIWVYPLLDSGIPGESLRNAILDALTPETARPQGDDVSVKAPEAVTFSITGTGVARGDLAKLKARLEATLDDAAGIWSRQLGNYLALSMLTAIARKESNLVDIDLTVTGLADRQLQPHQFAVLTSIAINLEVADD